MMRINFSRGVLLLLLISSHCASHKDIIRFDFQQDSSKKTYYLCASGYDTIVQGKVGHAGENELWIVFPDSALLYLSTEIFDGSTLNFKNRLYSSEPRKRTGYLDTLRSHGLQPNGLLWREDILGEVVVGYINVPRDEKDRFDRMLASLSRKRGKRTVDCPFGLMPD